jgi:uncharacterized Zn-binding protein involved in type VI secretion
MPIAPVAIVTTKLDPFGGEEGVLAKVPPGLLATVPGAGSVLIMGLPVATVGTQCTYHGNPNNPRAPGYNTVCAKSFVVEGIPTILVEGKPIAIAGRLGSLTTCGHFAFVSPNTTVMAGGAIG